MNAAGRFLLRVGAIASKETSHIRRDPRTLLMALGMPVLLILLFGYGVSFDLDGIALAVVDHDRSAESVALGNAFGASRDFRVVATPGDASTVHAMFRRNEATAALVIPAGLATRLRRGEPVTVQLLVDGADSSTASQAMAKAEALSAAVGARVAAVGPPRGGAPLSARVWTRFNPTGRSALFLVPGLVAYILAMVAVLLTALTVAREWERGSMEQLFATPVGRLELMLGKLLPYLVLGAVGVLLVLALGATVFDVPIRGSLPVLALSALLFLTAMLGQGLLISVVARNQMVATQVAVMSSMLPTMLLSGFMFPVENMPLVLRVIASAMPARYFVTALRGVLLRGNGAAELRTELGALACFAVAMVALAAARFQRRLD